MELVRYAESKCQTWLNENETVPSSPHEHKIEEPQVLSLCNICMVDGSWTSTSQFNRCGWVWMDNLEKIQLAHRIGSTKMGYEKYAPTLC